VQNLHAELPNISHCQLCGSQRQLRQVTLDYMTGSSQTKETISLKHQNIECEELSRLTLLISCPSTLNT
jgi:hypothetical protein